MAKTESRIEITARDRTRGALASVEGGLQRVSRAVLSTQTALLGLVGVGGIGAIVSSSLKAQDALGKTADKLGTTTEALAGLRLAASQTAGVTEQSLDTALQRLARRASEAQQGTGTLKKELEGLNINVQRFAQLTVDEQFNTLADAMAGVTNQGDRLRIAMAAFDTEGAALEATLKAGAGGLQEFRDTAEALGLALDRDTIRQIEATNDSLELMGGIAEGVGNQLTAALAPALGTISNALVQWSLDHDLVARTGQRMAEWLVTGLDLVVRGINAVGFAWDAMKAVFQATAQFIASGLEGIYSRIAAGLELIPGVGDTLAMPFNAAAEAMGNFSLSMESALEKSVEGMTAHAEFALEWGNLQRQIWDGLGTAAEENAEKQITALTDVAAVQAKVSKQMAQWDRFLAKEEKAANQTKIKSAQQYTNAAISLSSVLFGDTKAAAVASIVADTAAGIAKTWAQLGWPAALPGVAAIAASGAAQLASARGANKGGGGSISAGGGGGAVAPSPSPVLQDSALAAGPSTNVAISLSGGLYSKDDIRELIRNINEELGDGAQLVAT